MGPIQGLRFRVSEFRVSGFREEGLRFRVSGLTSKGFANTPSVLWERSLPWAR